MSGVGGAVAASLRSYAQRLYGKSVSVTRFLEKHMALVGLAWLLTAGPLSAWRLLNPAAPVHKLGDIVYDLLAYAIVIAAPMLGFMVALLASRSAMLASPNSIQFALWKRWHPLSPLEARTRPDFGAFGFLASLLVGLLLNVVIRTLEFMAAVPAMGAHAPAWGQALLGLMAADVALTGFFYMIAFVMALRTLPLFPRMLGFVWLLDITSQLYIARQIGRIADAPADVTGPLADLLHGNIMKVLISMLVWLPYLLLSERVNITYRHRTETPPVGDNPDGD